MDVIQVVVALGGTLVRGALAAMLAHEEDIEVVAELADAREVLCTAAAARHSQVIVLEMDLLDTDEVSKARELCSTVPGTRFLVLVDVAKTQAGRVPAECVPQVGFIATDASPPRLVEAIRQMARGEAVLDPEVAVAALTAAENPLTPREREILAIAAEGAPVREIAGQLYLAVGTVRNNLSRILAKTGARTRIEAIKIAQDAGWL